MKKYIVGNVKSIIYESNSGPYKVGVFRVKESNDEELLKYVPRGTNTAILDDISRDEIESVEIYIKYRGYIDREISNAEKVQRLERLEIPEGFDFEKVSGLSIECRQKLKKYAPRTIAQASRISGVSPSDISVLLVYFGR